MTEYKRIFLDTAPIIYYVEKKSGFFEKVNTFLTQNANADYYTSVVTVAEYFPYAFQQLNRKELFLEFSLFSEQIGLSFLNIDRAIAMESARIRADYRKFKTMDALQLAAALSVSCDLFFTNDKQLFQFKELTCVTLERLQP